MADTEKIREAYVDPSKYPDLVVRVTGFSAYFASLSPEFRQIVVDRIAVKASSRGYGAPWVDGLSVGFRLVVVPSSHG